MPSPEPLYGFKYSPWPSISTHAMFELFFKNNLFSIALFVAFCAKADPILLKAPAANVGRTVFAKNGKSLCGQACEEPKDPALNFHVVNNLMFTHFYCDTFSILTSFCHSVHV